MSASYRKQLKNRYKKLVDNSTRKEREDFLQECIDSGATTIEARGGRVAEHHELNDAQLKFMEEGHDELGAHAWCGDVNGYMMYGLNIEDGTVIPVALNDKANQN